MLDDLFPQDEEKKEEEQTNIQFTPALYVLLGSTPAQIGLRLKALQDRAYGDLPIYQYLWIDTDTSISPEIDKWMKSDNVTKTNIGRYDAATVLRHLDGYPAIKAWWPKIPHAGLSNLSQGAKQRRILGRLSLFALFDQTKDGEYSIRDSLERAAQRVAEISKYQKVNEMVVGNKTYSVDNSRVRVYLVNSMCGGTGSGIVFDITYLLRNFFEQNGVQAEIIAIQILPSVIERAIGQTDPYQRQKVKANAYGYLQDLEYLTENQNWNVEYPSMHVDQPYAPFDYFYVVDIANTAGQFLDEPMDVYKMISQAMFFLSITPMYGAHIGTLTNTAVFDRRYKGKLPYVSALSAANLIYPKERIAGYCAHRLINDLVTQLNGNEYEANEERPKHLQLIEELGLQPNILFNNIKDNLNVINDQLDFIKRAKEPGEALSYVSNERSNDEIERAQLFKTFTLNRESLTERAITDLRNKVAKINAEFGPKYAAGVLEAFLNDKAQNNSINAYTTRIDKDTSLEGDVLKYTDELEKSVNSLGDLSKKFIQTAFKWLLKKEWRDKFEALKADVITNMANQNAALLRQFIALQQKELYVAVGQEATSLKTALDGFLKQLTEISGAIAQRVDSLIHPRSSGNLFELSKEVVDGDYFVDYYESKIADINIQKVFADFMDLQVDQSIANLKTFENRGLYSALIKVASNRFSSLLDEINILEEMKSHYGDQYENVLSEKMDSVMKYCLPFWRYYRVDQNMLTASPYFIGVEDADSELIPEKYRRMGNVRIISTGIKDMVSFARTEHGIALWMLVEQQVWKKAYDDFMRISAGIDPINIIPESSSISIDPSASDANDTTFALGLAFGYITQRGAYYYFDKEKKYTDRSIQPDPAHRIGHGREASATSFATNFEWVNEIDSLVKDEIATIGNVQASAHLQQYINELEKSKDRLKVEDSNRKQYEKEIELIKTVIASLE